MRYLRVDMGYYEAVCGNSRYPSALAKHACKRLEEIKRLINELDQHCIVYREDEAVAVRYVGDGIIVDVAPAKDKELPPCKG